MLDIGPIHRKEYELESSQQSGSERPKKAATARNSSNNTPEKKVKRKTGASAGAEPQITEPVIIAQAPGRIHLLGEHGDPGASLYLSAAIDLWVNVAVSARKDNSIRFFAANLQERKRATLVNLKYKREDRWANFIKAAIYLFVDMGFPVRGMNFTVSGNIPQQIGLGSSAAIEIAAAIALRAFFKAKVTDQEMIKRLAAAHTAFFGKPAELADYIIGFSAKSDQFLIVDESDQSVIRIKSPFSRCRIILVDSRVPRFGMENELETRAEDLKKGLDLLSQGRQGASFREFATLDLLESMGNLPEVIRRRSLHVVQEIRRVMDAKDFLLRADTGGLSRLLFHSHEGLRDLYEVSCPEIDWMVKRAQETEGVLGARMTGLGFYGCTYAIVRNEMIDNYRSRIEDYERIFGFHPIVYEVKIATGSRIISG